MADIQWGPWNGHLRVGIDVVVSNSILTARYFVGGDGWDYDDPQILVRDGAIDGNTNYTNSMKGGHSQHQVQEVFIEILPARTRSVSPGGTYTMTARVSGAYDGSAPSVTVTYKEPVDLPSVPRNLAAPTVGVSSATITWTEPSAWGGDETGDYQVTYDENSGFSSPASTTVNDATSVGLSGLGSSHAYWVKVRAKNSAGYGPYTSPISFTTDAPPPVVPSAPGSPNDSNVDSDSATVTWAAPLSDGGAAIIDYQL